MRVRPFPPADDGLFRPALADAQIDDAVDAGIGALAAGGGGQGR